MTITGPGWLDDDPYEVLGVGREATAEQIREAYLARVKEHPPDRSPDRFEQIRGAYDMLRDPEKRASRLVESDEASRPMFRVGERLGPARAFVGPGPWLDVLGEEP